MRTVGIHSGLKGLRERLQEGVPVVSWFTQVNYARAELRCDRPAS